ncbi:MAG TPA: TauD/TfdA family dioxygenase [Ornithinimicrobium sp.]|uniref:TauD/TfdA dioxygenase family protein n=1 Tax=Ornithinimicrobium sp. TaxID=1977084 RepID=UPI002B4A26EA|nr:TauD/TfdA family dioxygenase [Ornithinimicrobium sp.]HKJ11083.1 TauD/TfdA family dioxygenase [Ornithinimicrobium sp.]
MNIAPLEPVGAVVTDLSLTDITASAAACLAGHLAEHGVLVFPGQHVDNDTFVGFLRQFGDLTFTVGETPVAGHPDLNLISNVGRSTPPKSTFHVDTSYVAQPPAYTALRAVTIPEQGGATLFTNQYRAYQTLPDELRDRLDGRTITHRVTGLDLDEDAETSADHPVFREHPLTGRRSLYLSTPARCVAISGLDDSTESQVVMRMLFEHSTSEDNTLRHTWSAGDIVMWDNACVLHKADHSGVVGDRVMHRGMVAAYPEAG